MAPQGDRRSAQVADGDVWRETAEQVMRAQVDLFQRSMASQLALLEEMRALGRRVGPREDQATFKTRITSGGRISVPDAEREALGLAEGDLVQVILVPLRRTVTPATKNQEER